MAITTYDKIKEVLDANSLLLKKDLELLSNKLETSRQISILKFRELKDDMDELKVHAKETNGYINDNKQSIILLEEKQGQESKRRRRMRAFSLTGFTAIIGGMITYIVRLISQ